MQGRALLVKGHKPNLALAMDHILIHTGAAAVITSVVDALQLAPKAALPSQETLERFGNTSVCSTYYILANIESRVILSYSSLPWSHGVAHAWEQPCVLNGSARSSCMQAHAAHATAATSHLVGLVQ